MDFYSNATYGGGVLDLSGLARDGGEAAGEGDGKTALTAADVESIVNNALASLRVYVVESDITSAQNSVRAVVEQATF